MANPPLEIKIVQREFSPQGWGLDYSLQSNYATPLFLVDDERFPFIRYKSEVGLVEIWIGIPPRSAAEMNIDVNALVMPRTKQIGPSSTLNGSLLVKWPLKLSGYWLNESDGPVLPLDPNSGFSATLVVGFGSEPLDGTRIRKIEDLFAWQTTTRSNSFTLKGKIAR